MGVREKGVIPQLETYVPIHIYMYIIIVHTYIHTRATGKYDKQMGDRFRLI